MTQIINEEYIFDAPPTFNVFPRDFTDQLVGSSPSVLNRTKWEANSNGVITNFLNGSEGQAISILGDGNTSVNNNAVIKTNTGATKTLLNKVVYTFTYYDGIWYENEGGVSGSSIPPDYSYLTDQALVIWDAITGSFQSIISLPDLYIDSAAVWSAKVDRAGDTMTGQLIIDADGPSSLFWRQLIIKPTTDVGPSAGWAALDLRAFGMKHGWQLKVSNPTGGGTSTGWFAISFTDNSDVDIGDPFIIDNVTGNIAIGGFIPGSFKFEVRNGGVKFGSTLEVGGAIKLDTLGAFAASDKYLIVDSSGNVHVSSLGPVS